MSARRLFTRRNVLIAGSAAIAAECLGLYIYRSRGERRYPARSLTELPHASAIRTLFEEGSEPTAPSYTCTAAQPVRVGPPGRWLPTFVAPSYTMPRARLEAYARARLQLPASESDARLDAQTLLLATAAAYFDAIPHRPEVRLGLRPARVLDGQDGGVPAGDVRAVLAPGTRLWERSFSVFGSWATAPPAAVDAAPVDAVVAAGGTYPPPCTMPSNAARVRADNPAPDAAGAVLYWRFDKLTDPKLPEVFDKMAQYGYPWRFMIGGFHELIVQDLPERNERGEELVRVTYALTEAYNLHPLGKKEEDKKTVPKWTLTFHRDYARSMLHGTIAQIEGN